MKSRRKVTLPDGSTGHENIDLRKKLNLSYRLYTNMLERRYVDLPSPRHPRRATCPTASWTCLRSPITCAYRSPARIEDVGLQAHRAPEDHRHKDRETSACQERRARRDAARHGQRHLVGNPMTSDIYSSHKTRARPGGSRPYKPEGFPCAHINTRRGVRRQPDSTQSQSTQTKWATSAI